MSTSEDVKVIPGPYNGEVKKGIVTQEYANYMHDRELKRIEEAKISYKLKAAAKAVLIAILSVIWAVISTVFLYTYNHFVYEEKYPLLTPILKLTVLSGKVIRAIYKAWRHVGFWTGVLIICSTYLALVFCGIFQSFGALWENFIWPYLHWEYKHTEMYQRFLENPYANRPTIITGWEISNRATEFLAALLGGLLFLGFALGLALLNGSIVAQEEKERAEKRRAAELLELQRQHQAKEHQKKELEYSSKQRSINYSRYHDFHVQTHGYPPQRPDRFT